MLKKTFKYIVISLFLMFSLNIVAHAETSYTKAVIVDTSGKALRKTANSSGSLITTLQYGSVVDVIESSGTGNGCGSNNWYKVKYSSNTGYICSSSVTFIDESVKGKKGYVGGEKNLRIAPSTASSSKILVAMPSGSNFEIIGKTSDNKYYYISYKDMQGFIYIYTDVKLLPDKEETDEEFIKNVLPNFPESYHAYLISIHNQHPTWKFEAYNTNVDFNTGVTKESVVGVSLTNSTYQGYYSTAGGSYDYTTDTFRVKEGKSWYAANSDVVAYYMDPRNYLNEKNIFTLEKLSYDETIHTEEAVKKTLSNYPNLLVYSKDFVDAGKDKGVSPVHLATRSAQEIGPTTTAISGTTKFTCSGSDTEYTGYYNFFSIGAYTSENPVILGLCYAMKAGWDTPYKSILGGASTIANGYINGGQDTEYLQRFNIRNGKITTSHQYMTNIAAPMTESSITYNGYKNSGLLEGGFVFKIPVYNNLPEAISVLPPEGNPNNYLKTVTIDGKVLDTFDMDKTSYTISLVKGTKSVNLSGLPVSTKSSISGTGDIDLTKTTTATITVTAQNKTTRSYKFTFKLIEPQYDKVEEIINNIGVKNDGTYLFEINNKSTDDLINEITNKNPSSSINFKDKDNNAKSNKSFSTGDKIVVSLGNDTKTYTIVVTGDTNGDGEIDVLDLLRVKKSILELIKLDGEYERACDVNSDGVVDILDLLKVKKHILGISSL